MSDGVGGGDNRMHWDEGWERRSMSASGDRGRKEVSRHRKWCATELGVRLGDWI